MSTCISCDITTPTGPQGLCHSCRDELRFVVRPEAHRESYRRRVSAEAGLRAEMERLGVVVISSVPDDNSLWLCDFCNTEIPVVGEYTLIPLLGSHALCLPCVSEIAYWPEWWTQPTPRACRCGACQTPILRALDLQHRRSRFRDQQRGIGL